MKHRYIWLVLLLAACKGKDPSTFPVRKDLTQAVYASGRIYPLNSYKVFSKIPGYVQEIHVGVGDHVKAGQALLTIRNEQSDINVGIARNTMELAAENAKENSALMEALKQEVASAKARYELDSSNFMRYRNLEKANAVSRQAFDQARTQYDISRQGYLRARSNLESTWQRLVLEYRNAQSQYQAQLTNKKEHTLYATINGMVYDLGVKDKGELVSPQQALLELGSVDGFEVELQVDETDIALIENGQEVLYTLDAYKNRTFKGWISETYPRITPGNRTAKVIASVETEVPVFSGMSVEANIIVTRKKDVLVIPREFVTGSGHVRLKETGELKKISRGAEDLEYVEVTGGITENTEIIKP